MLFIVVVIFAIGCTKIDDCDLCVNAPTDTACSVTVNFSRPDSYVTTTRSVEEETIGDIHLFLFGPKNYYRLVATGTMQIDMNIENAGAYTLIAITNYDGVNSSMDEQTLSELAYTGIGSDSEGRMTMSCRTEFEIKSGESASVSVMFERVLSKASFRISVADDYKFGIFSVQLINIPDRGFVVGQNTMPSDTDYSDYGAVEYDYVKTVEYNDVYMPENLKGTKTSIRTEKKRGVDNAPTNSTYLHIRGKYDQTEYVCDYYILLGGNTTNNFDVIRNRHYIYEILLEEYPYSETRMYWYSVELSEKSQWGYDVDKYSADQEITGQYGYWGYASTRYELRTHFVFDNENWNEIEFNGELLTSPEVDVDVPVAGSLYEYTIRYEQDYFIEGVNDELKYRIITTDQFGYRLEKVVIHKCYNTVTVEHSFDDEEYKGWITRYNQYAWFGGPTYSDRRSITGVAENSDSIQFLVGEGDDGAVFSAWYAEGRGGPVLSTERQIVIAPRKSRTILYAAFGSGTYDHIKVFTDLSNVSVKCYDKDGVTITPEIYEGSNYFVIPVGTTCELTFYKSTYWYNTREYSRTASTWVGYTKTLVKTPERDVMYWPST